MSRIVAAADSTARPGTIAAAAKRHAARSLAAPASPAATGRRTARHAAATAATIRNVHGSR